MLAGIQTYSRNGKLTGVFYGKRKYRLKRSLGIDIDIFKLKNKFQEREDSLRELRKNKREQSKDLGKYRGLR